MKSVTSSIVGAVALATLASVVFASPQPAASSQASSSPGNFSGQAEVSSANQSRSVMFQLWDDLTYLATEPDFLLVVGGLGAAPSVFDEGFESESARFSPLWGSSKLADHAFEAGEVIGDGRTQVAASIAAWSIGSIGHNAKLRHFGSDLFRALAIDGLYTGALKFAIHRRRPNGGSYSYPSGHTSSAFTTAGVIYRDFGKTWGIPAFLVASYVGVSRLQENKHFATDVVAGAILGSTISLKLANRKERQGELTLAPKSIEGTNGLAMIYHF